MYYSTAGVHCLGRIIRYKSKPYGKFFWVIVVTL